MGFQSWPVYQPLVLVMCTACQRSLDPFYLGCCYIKWGKTSRTSSMYTKCRLNYQCWINSSCMWFQSGSDYQTFTWLLLWVTFTACSRTLDSFYLVSCYIKWAKTSRTCSIYTKCRLNYQCWINSSCMWFQSGSAYRTLTWLLVLVPYTACPRSLDPFYLATLLYKMWQDFLDIQ